MGQNNNVLIVLIVLLLLAIGYIGYDYMTDDSVTADYKAHAEQVAADYKELQTIYDARTDSIKNRKGRYSTLAVKRTERGHTIARMENNLPKINEEFEKDIADIRDDDAVADFWAIGDIFEGHSINN